MAFSKLKYVLFILIGTILVGTVIFQLFYSTSFDNHFKRDIIDSMLAIIALLFAMEIYTFPYEGGLIIKAIYVTFPFFGMILVGFGIIELGMVVFTFRYRLQAWNEWMARTMEKHTILVGLGNVGTRILHELLEDDIFTTVIAVESERQTEFVERMMENPKCAVIFGDASQSALLEQANVKNARALLAVTNDDLVNFKIATKAKEMNPNIRTVIRTFDLDFAKRVSDLFDIDAAISTSAIAAPAFVATSFEDGIIQTLQSKKGETEFHLIELKLNSQFDPIKVETFEESFNVTILAVDKHAHPDSDDEIVSGSKLLLLGEIIALRTIKGQYCS